MTRYSGRPRAPSPPRSSSSGEEYTSDNTYSVVQDSVTSPPPPPPKTRHDPRQRQRLFGDSVNPSPAGSVLSSASSAESFHRTTTSSSSGQQTLAGIYSKNNSKYDAATVEEIKAQFQQQIESMLQSHERHETQPLKKTVVAQPSSTGLRSGHIPSNSERELKGIKDLERGKSFMEARNAVQKQIERMFSDASQSPNLMLHREIKHTMHGVSHALPGVNDDIKPPPPVHYGVNAAIRNGLNNRGKEETGNNRWQSVESLLAEQERHKESISSTKSKSDLSKFRSMDNVRGLSRTTADIDFEDDNDESVSDRMRKYKMENGKSLPDISTPSSQVQSRVASSQSSPTSSSASSSGSSSSEIGSSISSKQPPHMPSALKKEYVKHKVDYLGALPISNRSTNLSSLQRPLKDLYFKYRAMRNLGQTNLPGTLEINDTGLTVQYIRELHKGVQEIFNPFPTIAVWAAVKFVHKREVTRDGNVHHQFAFLPLISDPDSQEKHRLFNDLDFHEVELAADAPHPPVFACVMRRTGVPKQLECHGFVCTSSEDAIIIAANLYQSLLETMKKQRAQQARRGTRYAGSRSGASSTVTYEDEITPPPTVFSDSDANIPIRPPRKKKKSRTDTSMSTSQIVRRKSTRGSKTKKASLTYDPTRRSGRGGLGRTDSTRRSVRSNSSRSDFARRSMRRSGRRLDRATAYSMSNLGDVAKSNNGAKGDVYTRVAIPRSKSFMNVNSQYNLQELFRELKEKEGVESIDDVLKKVISPNGMSFNEIKPVYRELLLKLAMTMSQDEIFQRSKNIITQEKKKNEKKKDKKKKDGASGAGSENNHSTLGSFFKMTFSSSSKNHSLPSSKDSKKAKNRSKTDDTLSSQISSKKSSSGYESAAGSKPLPTLPVASQKPITKADIGSPLPLNTKSNKTPNLPRSTKLSTLTSTYKDDLVDDAYVSCSECGYESVCNYDTCSCRIKVPPPPKEYRAGPVHSSTGPFATQPHPQKPSVVATNGTLRRINSSKNQKSPVACETEIDYEIYHDCDADSCISSEKCYCSLRGDPREHLHPRPPSARNNVLKTRLQVSPPRQHPLHHRGPNNSTIIHCNGTDTISSVSTSSSCSTCMLYQCDSGSTATDTTCYSIRHRGVRNTICTVPTIHAADTNSHCSLLSGCESPQTAWRRNNKLLHDDSQCSECSNEAPLTRKNSGGSGGSGYHSNDSFPSPHHGMRSRSHENVLSPSACGSSSCSNGSSCSKSDMKRSNSKVLLLSAVDKTGKVVYRGASTSNLSTMMSDHAPSSHSGHAHHRSGHAPRDEKSILSMKKSAEIAAVFSGAKINQTTDIVDHNAATDMSEDDDDSTDAAYDSKRTSCSCGTPSNGNFSRSNMHSSLGYFP